MKNLWPITTWELSVPSILGSSVSSEHIYLVTSSLILRIDLESHEEFSIPLEEEILDLISVQYLEIQESLILVERSGQIRSYSEGAWSIEGEMTTEIACVSWSPNQEFLALTTVTGVLLLQTADFEMLKAENTGLGPRSGISWRGDSKFFYVSFETPQGFLAKCYTQTGENVPSEIKSDPDGELVINVNEKSVLTCPCISWMPRGALVTGISNDKVVMWEKNGLLHGEFSVESATGICWSTNSLFLSVWNQYTVHVYYRSNYKWFLKYTVENQGTIQTTWNENTLVVTGKDCVKCLEFSMRYDTAEGLCAVVDKNKLMCSDFTKGIIPPPMCHFEVDLDFQPTQLSVGDDKTIAMADSNGNLYLYSQEIVRIGHFKEITFVCNWKSNVLVGAHKQVLDRNGEVLFTYEEEIRHIKVIKDKLYVETWDSERKASHIYEEDKSLGKFKEPSQNFYVIFQKEVPKIVRLCNRKLYLDSELVTNNCTSVLYSGEFLFFSKFNSPLGVLYTINTQSDTIQVNEDFSRGIERESELVTLVNISLILQHFRGNLETVTPRKVLIHTVESLLVQQKYKESFELLRRHKLDLNFLYDFSPENFEVELFIQQVQKTDFINLFLTSLKKSESSNSLCQSFIDKLDQSTHILSIITAYVSKSPSDLQAALRWIQDIRKTRPFNRPPGSQTSGGIYTKDALKYLCWLADPDKLYNVALGMYDLELATTIAQFTQKDPKEYLPYLKMLDSLSLIDRKFKICMDLQDFQGALKELVKEGQVDQAINLILDKELYVLGLELMDTSRVKVAVADAFCDKNLHLQAAGLYLAAGETEKAIQAYIKADDWDMALNMSKHFAIDISESQTSSGSIFSEVGRYEEAAKLSSDSLSACRYLLQAGKYKEALSFAFSDAARELYFGSLQSFSSGMLDEIEKTRAMWENKQNRLKIVQKNKQAMPVPEIADDDTASQYSQGSTYTKASQFTKKQRKKLNKLRKTAAKEGSQYEEDYLVDFLLTLRPDLSFFNKVESLCTALVMTAQFTLAKKLWDEFKKLVKLTSEKVRTLRHTEFLKKFAEQFPDIAVEGTSEAALCDMFSRNMFLPDGLATHEPIVFPKSKFEDFFHKVKF